MAIDKEVDSRLTKANNAFGRLYKRVWNNNSLKQTPRSASTEPCANHASLWIVYVLSTYHNHWSDYVTNVEVLEKAGTTTSSCTARDTSLERLTTSYQGSRYSENCHLVTATWRTEEALQRYAKEGPHCLRRRLAALDYQCC